MTKIARLPNHPAPGECLAQLSVSPLLRPASRHK
jgi:hypothetical protein